ncbi:MAG: gamma-glutamyl-gamma-aminobutyrate hydrolase family protein [Chloroflexota bacterium]|nr:gamma-glutamyl-gamma-aminobutyrate hydrolase family protein [Chloroflexota bacterium]
MTRPIIGITTGGRSEGYIKSRHYDEFYSLPAPYVDAVRRAGGIPLLIAPGESEWGEILPLLDGVIVTGGTDIDPAEYGGDRWNPHVLPADRERDRSELGLARRLLDEGVKPLLCICRGLQVLNVAAGGTLHEHIPDIRDDDIHRNEAGLWAMQEVQVESDSLIAEVMGLTALRTSSGHHQAVKAVAPSLRVVASAADGIIEALEKPGHPWLIAVQWHPEVTAGRDPSQQALFDALVRKARQAQRERVIG